MGFKLERTMLIKSTCHKSAKVTGSYNNNDNGSDRYVWPYSLLYQVRIAHLAPLPPLLPHRFHAAEREIQSPDRAAEEVLITGRFLHNQSTIVAI